MAESIEPSAASADPRTAQRVPRRSRWPAAFWFVLAAGAALRFLGLDRQSLWRDETITLYHARYESLSESIAWLARSDVHPPLPDVVYTFWIRAFGDSVPALRSLAALFGVGAILAVYALGRRLLGERAALLAALLQACSLMQIYYSQEVRGYSMLVFLAVLAMHAMLRWIERRNAGSAVYYVLASTAALYTHAFGVFVPLVQNLFVAGVLARRTREPRKLLLAWFGLQCSVLLLFSPWIPSLLGQTGSEAKDWLWQPDAGSLAASVAMFLSIVKPPWATSPDLARIGVALVLVPLLAFAVSRCARRPSLSPEPAPAGAYALLALWLLAPMLLAWLVSQTELHIFTYRNLILCAPALYLLLGAAVARLARRGTRALAIGLLLAPAAGSSVWYYGEIHKEDWRGAQRYVQESFEPTDQLNVVKGDSVGALRRTYYLDLEHLRSEVPVTVDLQAEDPQGARVWDIAFRPRRTKKKLLDLGYAFQGYREFHGGIVVGLYARKPAPPSGE